jgi:hypothetical protein
MVAADLGRATVSQREYQQHAERQPGPALAVIAAAVGLALAGTLVWQTIDLMSMIDGEGLPGTWGSTNVVHLTVAGIVLLSAALVFARVLAGAYLLCSGAMTALAALLVLPALVEGIAFSMTSARPGFVPTGGYGDYVRAMFEFGNVQAVLRFVALVLAAVLVVIALLPPSLGWLRRRDHYGHAEQRAARWLFPFRTTVPDDGQPRGNP